MTQWVTQYKVETEREVKEMRKRLRREMDLAEIGIRERRSAMFEAEKREAERKFRDMRQG